MQAHVHSKEFYFPPPKRMTDLESLEKMGPDRYVVDVVVDIASISAADQHATLREIFNEIIRKKSPSHISDNEKFDTLYAFAKALREPGLVGKEARQIMAENLSSLLRKLCKMVAAYFSQSRSEEIELIRRVGRSTIKMYCFLLTQVLSTTVGEEVSAGDTLVVTTQAIRTKRKRGAPPIAGGAGSGGSRHEENDCGVEISTREMSVAAFSDVLSPDLARVWNDGVIDDAVLDALLRTVLHMLTQRSNVEGDDNPVADGLRLLLANLVQRYTAAFLEAEEAKAREGRPIVAINPADVIVTPLVEQMMRSAGIAKFCSRLLVLIDNEDETKTWSHAFMGMLLEAVASAAINDVVGDGPAAKNVAAFVEEQAHSHATATHRFSQFFLPLLHSESYEVRKGAMSALAELIQQRVRSTAHSTLEDEAQRDRYLEDLWMRMRDVNNFARAHCIKLWTALVERKAVPRRYHMRVVEEAVGRLSDRYIHARRGAMQLLAACMKRQWYHNVLSLSLLEGKLVQHTRSTRERYSAMGLDFEAALTAARAAYAPVVVPDVAASVEGGGGGGDSSLARPSGRLGTGAGDAPIPGSPTQDGRNTSGRPSTASAFSAAAAATAADGVSSTRSSGAFGGVAGHAAAAGAGAPPVDPDVARVAFYEAAVHFTTQLHTALEHAAQLLESRSTQDATEAMEFVVTCSEFKIETAPRAILKMLVMIYIHDPAIQQAVCDAFLFMFFRTLTKEQTAAAAAGQPGGGGMSTMARNLVRVQKLLQVLATANAGEASAMERIIATIRARTGSSNFITESFVDAVWGVVDGSLDDGTATASERRLAMRLYAMLAAAIPRDVGARREAIVEVMRRNATDNVLLAHAFSALQKEALNRTFAPIPDPATADEPDHPVIRLAVHVLCRPTTQLGSWTQLADAAVSAVHLLHATPVTVYQRVVAFLANKFQQSADTSVLAQLFVVVGHSAIKHLVSIDCYERSQMRKLDDPRAAAEAAGRSSGGSGSGGTPQAAAVDVMHKELGMGTNEFARHELLESCARAKLQMLDDAESIWGRVAPLVVSACKKSPSDAIFQSCPPLRIAAILTLTNLMITNEGFCERHLKLLFGLLKNESESWEVKTNVVVALGDLCCVHPNSLQQFMKVSSSGFYALLADSDRRVRATTVQVCTHLVLNDMLRVHDHLHTIVRLVADPDETIAANAIMFVRHLAVKCKQNIGNLIPPLVPQLAHVMEKEKFEMALRTLLEKVEKDKPTESVIEKLCQRFGAYSEHAGRAQTLARRLAFCLSELNFNTERAMKKLMSENVYQNYRQWLRDPEVLAAFQHIATKARRAGMGAVAAPSSERRDRAAIDEWEQRLVADANVIEIAPGSLGERGSRQSGNTGTGAAADELLGAAGAAAEGDGEGEVEGGEQPSQYRLLDPTSSDSEEDAVVGMEGAPTRTERHVRAEQQRRSCELRRSERAQSPEASDGGGGGSGDSLPTKRARRGGGESRGGGGRERTVPTLASGASGDSGGSSSDGSGSSSESAEQEGGAPRNARGRARGGVRNRGARGGRARGRAPN